jgi:hypothetical protein
MRVAGLCIHPCALASCVCLQSAPYCLPTGAKELVQCAVLSTSSNRTLTSSLDEPAPVLRTFTQYASCEEDIRHRSSSFWAFEVRHNDAPPTPRADDSVHPFLTLSSPLSSVSLSVRRRRQCVGDDEATTRRPHATSSTTRSTRQLITPHHTTRPAQRSATRLHSQCHTYRYCAAQCLSLWPLDPHDDVTVQHKHKLSSMI